MAQPVSFLAKIWPTEQQARFLGAALAAGVAIYLPRGSQELALGRYLLFGSSNPIDLTLFYKQKQIDQAQKSPWGVFFIGHLWDLAHKVLATAAFYLTSKYSMAAGVKVFLPAFVRTSGIAQKAFRALESPPLSNNILLRYHLLDLTPLLFKLVHLLLDVKSVSDKGQNPTTEAWKEWAHRWGQRAETLCYLRLATVAFGAAGGVSVILGYMFVQALQAFLKVEHYAYFPNTPWQSIVHLAIAAYTGLIAAFESVGFHHASRLSKLSGLVAKIQSRSWDAAELKQLLSNLKMAKYTEQLGRHEFDHACGVIQANLAEILEKEIYLQWTGDQFASLKDYEESIRKIYAPDGIFEQLLGTFSQTRCERMRFFIMLLGVNLRRLKASADNQAVTVQEAERIQDFLYFQTVKNIQGDISQENLMICNLGENFLSTYRKWKDYRYLSDQDLRKEIQKDPFFKPIFDMLPLIDHSSSFLSGPLQLLFISLTLYLGKSTTTVPGIQQGGGDSFSEQARLSYENTRSTNSAAHYQRYSQTPDAATKTFDEIVTICQGW